jgi:hypothetical protein
MSKYSEQTHRLAASILTCKESKIHELRLLLRELRMLRKLLSNPSTGGTSVKKSVKTTAKSGSAQNHKQSTKKGSRSSAEDQLPRSSHGKNTKPSELGQNSQEDSPVVSVATKKSKGSKKPKPTASRENAPTRNFNFPHHPAVCPNMDKDTPTKDSVVPFLCNHPKCPKSKADPRTLYGYTGPRPTKEMQPPRSKIAPGKIPAGASSSKGTSVPNPTPSTAREVKNKTAKPSSKKESSQKVPPTSEKGASQASTPKVTTVPENKSSCFECKCALWLASKGATPQTIGSHTVMANCQSWRAKVGKVAKAQAEARKRKAQKDETRDQASPDKEVSASGERGAPAKPPSAQKLTRSNAPRVRPKGILLPPTNAKELREVVNAISRGIDPPEGW